ncbi:MAG: recombinase family protein [Candidatus Cloacimonetes bacterium]|jgi:DNA invertase Pin-like site-specific DNA recombinase|nr:recombinase family protein [Candidatus Cloacimonadota bacterium]
MLIGYARVSTVEQNLDMQVDALNKAGCEKIFSDVASGAKTERKQLQDALRHIRKGDVLVVWKLDRLGRSLKHLIQIVSDLDDKGIGFKSLQENIDTTTNGGKLIFHIFGALAEFEREIIRERTKAGLAAARSRGKLGGRPRKMDESKIEMAQALYDKKSIPIKEICERLGISKGTFYRYIKC